MPHILVINGGLRGREGNSAALLAALDFPLKKRATTALVHLGEQSPASVLEEVGRADGLVVATGTYWDSWSSPLQTFLEAATPTEGTALWLGKPVAVLVTMHAVGGKGVLSRLQGVLNTYGCLIPPMSGLVYSALNQEVLVSNSPLGQDLWCLDDLEIIAHNLLQAVEITHGNSYLAWPVNRENVHARWLKKSELGS